MNSTPPRVYQLLYATIKHVGHVQDEILQQAYVKLEVDPHVVQCPIVQLFAHVQGLASVIEDEEGLYVSGVVA